MVVEKAKSTVIDAEIISVKDLLPGSSTPAAAAGPAGDAVDGIQKIEGWLKMLDRGISLADRGVTLFGKAEGIVKNLTDVAHHKLAIQQQPQQQPVIMQQGPPPQIPPPAPPAEPPRIPITIQGKQAMMTPDEVSQLIEQLQRPPATADQISGVLGMLLGQSPSMSVEELKTLIDRNPKQIDHLIAFGTGGRLGCGTTNE